MTTEKQTPEALAAECKRLAKIAANASVDWDGASNAESHRAVSRAFADLHAAIDRLAAIASAQTVDDLNSARERVAATGKPSLSELIERFGSAQAQQEPVAWMSTVMCIGPDYGKVRFDKLPIQSLQEGYYSHTPLYTAPPVQQGPKTCHDLTPEQHEELTKQFDAADALEETGWVFDGDEWLRPTVQQAELSDPDVIARAEAAGMKWIPPDDDGEYGFPGGFDMSDIASVRKLIEGAPRPERAGVVTPAMVEAGAKAAREYMERTGGNDPAVIYRAMVNAAPPAPAVEKRQGLTDEQIEDAVRDVWTVPGQHATRWARFARAIERAHGIPPADAKEGK